MSPGLAVRALLLYFATAFTHHPRPATLADCDELGGSVPNQAATAATRGGNTFSRIGRCSRAAAAASTMSAYHIQS